MCLLAVAWQHHPELPLVVAGNRDEFHGRATRPAAFWPDAPQVLAGRDEQAGGTWLGMTRDGRFAAVTNVREPAAAAGIRSRGELTADFLAGKDSAAAAAQRAVAEGAAYSGFNLLLGDGRDLYYASNRDPGSPRRLEPGIHALSNHLLETPWPKLLRLREKLREALAGPVTTEVLLAMLEDRRPAPPERLPDTGLPPELERRLSAPFVVGEEYGTRSSTVVLAGRDRIDFRERRFAPDGRASGESPFAFTLESGTSRAHSLQGPI